MNLPGQVVDVCPGTLDDGKTSLAAVQSVAREVEVWIRSHQRL